MGKDELLTISKAVANLIPRLARGIGSPQNDPANSLPLAQLRVCGILADGPRSMSMLSRELGVSLSALTQIADRLEREHLVKRVAAGNDRRVRWLQLTKRGEKMMVRRREIRDERVLAILERLTSQQREAVRSSLEMLVEVSESLARQSEPDAVSGNGHVRDAAESARGIDSRHQVKVRNLKVNA